MRNVRVTCHAALHQKFYGLVAKHPDADVRQVEVVLQQFREGPGQILTDLMYQASSLSDKNTVLAIIAVIYWCISKETGDWLWLGWSTNRLLNDALKATFCVYRPWIRDPRVVPDAAAKAAASGYSFPSSHAANAASLYGAGAINKRSGKLPL